MLCVECVCMCAHVYMVCMMQYACSGSVLACTCSMCVYRMCVCTMHSVFVVNIRHVCVYINVYSYKYTVCAYHVCLYKHSVSGCEHFLLLVFSCPLPSLPGSYCAMLTFSFHFPMMSICRAVWAPSPQNFQPDRSGSILNHVSVSSAAGFLVALHEFQTRFQNTLV